MRTSSDKPFSSSRCCTNSHVIGRGELNEVTVHENLNFERITILKHAPAEHECVFTDAVHSFHCRSLLAELDDSFSSVLATSVDDDESALDLTELREGFAQKFVRHKLVQVLDANGGRMWSVTHAQNATVEFQTIACALRCFTVLACVLLIKA